MRKLFISSVAAVAVFVMRPLAVCQLAIWGGTKRLPHSVKRVFFGTCAILLPDPVTMKLFHLLANPKDWPDWSDEDGL